MAIPAWRWVRWKQVKKVGENPVRYVLQATDGSATMEFSVRYTSPHRCLLDGPVTLARGGSQRKFTSAADLLVFLAEHLMAIPREMPRCVFEHELPLSGLGADKEDIMEGALRVVALLWGARTAGDDWFWELVERIAKAWESPAAALSG